MRDYLDQEITEGALIAYSYNLWRGRDEIRVGQVKRTTAKRVFLVAGSWVTPSKVLVLNEVALERVKLQTDREREEEEEDDSTGR